MLAMSACMLASYTGCKCAGVFCFVRSICYMLISNLSSVHGYVEELR